MDKSSEFWHIVERGGSDLSKLTGIGYIWSAPQKRNETVSDFAARYIEGNLLLAQRSALDLLQTETGLAGLFATK